MRPLKRFPTFAAPLLVLPGLVGCSAIQGFQDAAMMEPIKHIYEVQVLDDAGQPVEGATVRFRLEDPGIATNETTETTDARGKARGIVRAVPREPTLEHGAYASRVEYVVQRVGYREVRGEASSGYTSNRAPAQLWPIEVSLVRDMGWGETRYVHGATNLRGGRSTQTPIVGRVQPGQPLRVDLPRGNWYAVFRAGEHRRSESAAIGYIYAPLLRTTPTPVATAGPDAGEADEGEVDGTELAAAGTTDDDAGEDDEASASGGEDAEPVDEGPKVEHKLKMRVKRIAARRILVEIATTLPDGAKLWVQVSRSYYLEDSPRRSAGRFFDQDLVVEDGRVDVEVDIDDGKWHDGLVNVLRQKAQKISPNVLVSVIFAPDRNQPPELAETVGLRGERLTGPNATEVGPVTVLQLERAIAVPFKP